MTSTPPTTIACPSCGTPASGRFCKQCGAALTAHACGSCGAPMSPSARFCAACGVPAAGGPRPAASSRIAAGQGARTPWIIAGVLTVGLLGAVGVAAKRQSPAGSVGPSAEAAVPGGEAPFAGGAGGGTPPDISNMSPKERFDRLYNRIMQATEAGDMASAERFTPMALMAYTQLDKIDADARYHAALLKLHTGDIAGAKALGDSILVIDPGHLFGYIVLGTAARWAKDSTAMVKATTDFNTHYDAELKKNRPEYAEHKRALDQFKDQAKAR